MNARGTPLLATDLIKNYPFREATFQQNSPNELRDTDYSETLEFTQELETKHILPQEWLHHWSLPGDRPAEAERIERDEVKNTVGNLTILTDKLNPSISNAAWDDKREAIQDHTVLLLNKHLVDTSRGV